MTNRNKILSDLVNHPNLNRMTDLATKVPEITRAHGWVGTVTPLLQGAIQPLDTNSSKIGELRCH